MHWHEAVLNAKIVLLIETFVVVFFLASAFVDTTDENSFV